MPRRRKDGRKWEKVFGPDGKFKGIRLSDPMGAGGEPQSSPTGDEPSTPWEAPEPLAPSQPPLSDSRTGARPAAQGRIPCPQCHTYKMPHEYVRGERICRWCAYHPKPARVARPGMEIRGIPLDAT
jgi:hypothetical protein